MDGDGLGLEDDEEADLEDYEGSLSDGEGAGASSGEEEEHSGSEEGASDLPRKRRPSAWPSLLHLNSKADSICCCSSR